MRGQLEKNVNSIGDAMSPVEAANEENMLRILVKKYPFKALDYIPRKMIAEYFESHKFSARLVAATMREDEFLAEAVTRGIIKVGG